MQAFHKRSHNFVYPGDYPSSELKNLTVCQKQQFSAIPDDLGTDEPCQPRLKVYPLTAFGDKTRAFNAMWFSGRPWLEYSVRLDKCFCFPCQKYLDLEHLKDRVFSSEDLVTGNFCYGKGKRVRQTRVFSISYVRHAEVERAFREKRKRIRNSAACVTSSYQNEQILSVKHL